MNNTEQKTGTAMIKLSKFSLAFFVCFTITSQIKAEAWTVASPEGRLEVKIEQNDGISYSVQCKNLPIVAPSEIDLKIGDIGWLGKKATRSVGSTRLQSETVTFPVPRKYRQRESKWNEFSLQISEAAKLVFRVYDEGVAYRWELALPSAIIVEEEKAEFLFKQQAQVWFPEEESMYSHQERVYKHLPLTEITQERFGSTGLLVDLSNGYKVYISESDLRSYPGMFLRGNGAEQGGLVGKFAAYPLETKVTSDRDVRVTKEANFLAKTSGTRTFPWRVMIVTDSDKQLLETELIFELAPQQAFEDTSWIKPGKVAWDWWNANGIWDVDFEVGINTETYKEFIDFASENQLEYIILDEGWTATTTDILHEQPEIDLEEIVEYGKSKNVGVILWVLWHALEENFDEGLDRFERLGVAGIKVDFFQRDDQLMMDFYERIAIGAAKRHLLIDNHGACKPTGFARQYPNVITSEGVNGLEQYKWSKGRATPETELILPFIRMVSGPMDFTPGAMQNANRKSFRTVFDQPMSMGTRCHQLAMYVVYESPLQMLADSPTRYRQEPECMRFLSPVPTVWDELKVLEAKISDYVVLARRTGDQWYLAAMTDWEKREFEVSLDFLPAGKYELEVWQDGPNAKRNGQDFSCYSQQVQPGDTVTLKLAPGGGWVGRLSPAATD